VFFGHGEALHIETNSPISAEEVKELLAQSPGLVVCHKDEDFPTQITDASGKDDTFVGRIREDISHNCGINMWIVADNVRKGAATNSVQIAELLIKDHLS
jgi:aspartate-semialdehyde dehydrogenase